MTLFVFVFVLVFESVLVYVSVFRCVRVQVCVSCARAGVFVCWLLRVCPTSLCVFVHISVGVFVRVRVFV